MDHEVETWKMAFFHSSIPLKYQSTKFLGPLTRCKSNVFGPRGMAMQQKVNVLIFLVYEPYGGTSVSHNTPNKP